MRQPKIKYTDGFDKLIIVFLILFSLYAVWERHELKQVSQKVEKLARARGENQSRIIYAVKDLLPEDDLNFIIKNWDNAEYKTEIDLERLKQIKEQKE